jgi:hypothetical protein
MPGVSASETRSSEVAPARPATASELAILNHPDQRTSWIVVTTATLRRADPDLAPRIAQRLRDLGDEAPALWSRWDGAGWQPAGAPDPVVVDGDPLQAPGLLTRFDLAREPPARFVVARDGGRLALAAHHAAFDGLSMLALIGAVLGHELAAPATATATPARPAKRELGLGLLGPLQRLMSPADRVAASPAPVARDSFAVREIGVRPPNITGQIARATIDAVGARNAALGADWNRIGLTIALGGPPAIGNVASYRRLDLRAGDDVAASVQVALRSGVEPGELATTLPRRLRLLAPVTDRLSDSVLVSNLGFTSLPELSRLCLFPVARGRSAVAVGASSVSRGRTTVALRARDLSPADAESLLDDVVAGLRCASD